MTSPIAKILLRSLVATLIFVVLYGIYMAIGRQPGIPGTLAVIAAFSFAANLLVERFVRPRIGA